MAKLSAHGTEIGRIEFLTRTKAYFSDGKILQNSGHGWKLHAKVKPGILPSDAFARAQALQAQFMRDNPEYARFHCMLHEACGSLAKRWKLYYAIEMMPTDCDGVWSEVCDGYSDNIHISVEEVGKLCDAYITCTRETAARKASQIAA